MTCYTDESLLTSRESGVVHLARPLPIYFLYWTIDLIDGQLHHFADVYDEDIKLIQALASATQEAHHRDWYPRSGD